MSRSMSLMGLVALMALMVSTVSAQEKANGTKPTLEESLKWLQSLPKMGGVVNKDLDPDRFKKMTVKYLETLKQIQIGGHPAGMKGHVNLPQDEYRYLTALPALEIAKFPENDLADAAMAHICKIKTLKELQLMECNITNAGLKHLANLPELTSLDLGFCNFIDDAGLVEVEKLTKLQQLGLRGKKLKVTPAGIAKLQKALPNCKITTSP